MTGIDQRQLHLVLAAGEASGDILGANLILALRKRFPNARFSGIVGPQMLAAGCEPIIHIEQIAVMGIWEVLKDLPRLLKLRRNFIHKVLAIKPDVFIGIDAPDFNLQVELKLKAAGIPTVHYNSPKVWAWRKGRLKTIAQAVDQVLCLFPFEAEIYHERNIPAQFVGHPMADLIPVEVDTQHYRAQLGIKAPGNVIAVLPGSRGMELKFLAEPFVKTMQWCLQQQPDLQFIMPAANAARRRDFEQALRQCKAENLPLTIFDGQADDVLGACDVVLVASGTATLQAMLYKKPMVVAYGGSWLSYIILNTVRKGRSISLPNILARAKLVPEYIQQEVKPEVLGQALLERLPGKPATAGLHENFTRIHQQLRLGASEQAATAIEELL